MSLSDKVYLGRDIVGESFDGLIRESDVKAFIKELKEKLVCEYCKGYPHLMCSACNNARIKIDELAGEKLI